MPALEWSGALVGDPDGAAAGFQTARDIVTRLQRSAVSCAVCSHAKPFHRITRPAL